MKTLLEAINHQVVPPQLIADAAKLHSELKPEDRRDLTEKILCIIKATNAVETAEDRGRLGTSIMFRPEALAKFLSSDFGKKLVNDRGEEAVRVPWELVVAAAQERLIEGAHGRPEFAELSFVNRFLAIKEPVGTV